MISSRMSRVAPLPRAGMLAVTAFVAAILGWSSMVSPAAAYSNPSFATSIGNQA